VRVFVLMRRRDIFLDKTGDDGYGGPCRRGGGSIAHSKDLNSKKGESWQEPKSADPGIITGITL